MLAIDVNMTGNVPTDVVATACEVAPIPESWSGLIAIAVVAGTEAKFTPASSER